MYDEILDILKRYVSSINAQSILGRLVTEQGVSRDTVAAHHIRDFMPKLERDMGLFLEPGQQHRMRAELEAIVGARPAVRGHSLSLRQESDIGEARMRARTICEDLGARSLALHKVATVVSELARNIVSYAGSGTIELVPLTHPSRRVIVRAIDRGPGIPHLDDIMAGNWRSKTGLGQGLRGIKRMADRFEISTGARGTRIEVEIEVAR
jgi:serine/threonine-protein kinase RsbT